MRFFVLLSLSLCDAWVVQSPARPSVVSIRRVAASQIQAQAQDDGPEEPQPTGMTPERRRFEVDQKGFLFFQAATPKTGVQEGMPDFFSKENFDGSTEIGLVPKITFGVFGVLFLGLLVTLITA